MITKADVLMGRAQLFPNDYTDEISANVDNLVSVINDTLSQFPGDLTVLSGWRPPSINDKTSNAAAHSKHLVGLAVDLADADGKLWTWILDRLGLMQEKGVYMEDKRWTSEDNNGGWVHCQIVPPGSGHRIFIPSSAPPVSVKWFDGVYNHAFDGAPSVSA